MYKKIISNYGLYLMLLVLTIYLTRVIVTNLSDIEYGVHLTWVSVTSWLMIQNSGIVNSIKNAIAKGRGTKNEDEIPIIISTSIYIFSFLGVLIFVLSMIFVFLNGSTHLFGYNYSGYMIVYSFYVFTSMPFQTVDAVYLGMEKVGITRLIGILKIALQILILMIILKFNDLNLVILAFSMLTSHLVVNMISIKQLRRVIQFDYFLYSKKKLKQLFESAKFFLLISFSIQVLNSTDNIVISTFIGIDKVANYNLMYKLFMLVVLLFNVLMSIMWPNITRLFYEKNLKKEYKKILKILLIGVSSAILVIITILLNLDYITNILYGRTLNYDSMLLILMSGYAGLHIMNSILGTALSAIDFIKDQAIISFVISLLNIALSILLVNLIGINGVILATNIVLILNFVYLVRAIYKQRVKLFNSL